IGTIREKIPLEGIILRDPFPADLVPLVGRAELASIRWLGMRAASGESIRAVLRSPHWIRLDRLILGRCEFRAGDILALSELPVLRRVRELRLRNLALPLDRLEFMLGLWPLDRLEELWLEGCRVEPATLAALALLPRLSQLRVLGMGTLSFEEPVA